MPIGLNVSAHRAASMGFTVDMDPSPMLLVAQFNKLGMDIRSFREPLKRAIQQVVGPSLVKNFHAQGRPDRWPELAESTYQRKVAAGFTTNANRPLVRTGALRKKAGQLNLWKIDGREGTAELALPEAIWYGQMHQEGNGGQGSGGVWRRKDRITGRIKEIPFGDVGWLPQRMWALLQDEDIDDIEAVFGHWLQERALMSGFR